jgi:hypothetical protein
MRDKRVVITPAERLDGSAMQQSGGAVRDLKLIYPETGFDALTPCHGQAVSATVRRHPYRPFRTGTYAKLSPTCVRVRSRPSEAVQGVQSHSRSHCGETRGGRCALRRSPSGV